MSSARSGSSAPASRSSVPQYTLIRLLVAGLAVGLVVGSAQGQGATWTQLSPATSPPGRSAASMAYDAGTGQLVLFGGSGIYVWNDTWTWNGTNWTQLSPASSPPNRDLASMAYDAATGQIVLFGGVTVSHTALGDTWVWDGATWTPMYPASSPSARTGATMAYDAATGQMVLFGGYNGTNLGDTWVWDGATWTQLNPASSPPAGGGASMAYDAATGQTVLFVGSGTWTWNGTTWTQQSPANSPPARSEASMAYDSATGQVVLFGGYGYSAALNDTWTWNGTTWTQEHPVSSPSMRDSASMAYDAATGQVVLFGGYGYDTWVDDTWNLQLGSTGSGVLTGVTSANAGVANVCPSGQSTPAPCSQSATVSFTVGASPTTVVNVNVLTQGTPNLDYTLGSTTCIGLLAANSSCTVTVKFAPLFPGQRNGAITLTDSSGNLLASTLLYGTGDGPLAVTLPGTISTIAGNGTGDFSGDGGAATSAEIYQPQGLAVSADGDVYFADTTNNRIRKVTAATGVISTVAGTDYQGYFGDGGPATSAEFTLAQSVAVDGAGNVYIGDMVNNRIRKVTAATGIISTVTGNGTEGSSGDGGPATSAEIDNPLGLAVDGAGNLYIAGRDSRIRKVTAATGLISTVAGNGTQGFSGDGGAATSAKVFEPEGVAVDVAGNLFIADTFNDRVREVAAATGIITTVAGGGSGGDPGDGGPATSASLDGPFNVAVDGIGNVYITDLQDRIRKVTATTGIISTIAGDGVEGYSGDGGAATNAEIDDPFGVAVDGAGNVYISDEFNNRVRKVTATAAALVYPTSTLDGTTDSTDGAQTVTLANIGNEPLSIGVPLGGGTNPAVGADFSWNNLGSAACPSLTSSASSASTLAAGATCNLPVIFSPVSPSSGPLSESVVVTDNSLNATNATQTIGLSGTAKTASGVAPVISNVATPGGGSGSMTVTWTTDQPATSQVNYGTTTAYGSSSPLDATLVTAHTVTLTGLAVGTTYDFDVVSANAASQSTTSPNAMFTTVGSAATPSFLPSGGTYTSPLTVSMSSNKGVSIYYTTDGTMPTTASLLYRGSVAVTSSETINAIAAGFVYGTSSVGSATYVINNVLGVISTYAGNGTAGYGGDSAGATSAELNSPWGTAVDSSGNLYIADWHNQRIRKVTPAGVISTVAGNGTAGYSGDGGAATSAELDYPTSVAVDGSGNLYISDTGNSRIREVTTAGVISTYAGNGTAGYYGDGGAATSAEISNARGIALDTSGNLYIADLNNMRVRKVTPSGVISTVAGNGTQGYSGDGGAATSAELNQPIGVALDTSGGLYIADSFNNRIRKVTAAGVISTVAGNGTSGYSGDGGPATSAELADSSGVAVDSSGTIYIADWETERIRKVTPAGIISTAAGNGASGTGGFGAYSGDGGAATSAELSEPVGVTVDSSGNLYIADLANNRIRKVTYQTAFVTWTTVAASPNPATTGQAVTLTATVSSSGGPPPDGEGVFFFNNGQALSTTAATLSGGIASFTTSALPPDTNAITATYGGDLTFLPSSGSVSEVVSGGVPPQVGYVAFWGINNSGITVSWSTDVPANTQLAYGTTASLGQLSPLQTALTQSHGVVLTTLSPGTTYYFVAQSTGANGATGYSTTYSFTTTGTAPAGPPVISNVMATNITNTSATITWTTDQASSSLVNFGTTNGYGSSSTLDTTLVTSHSVTLTGLTLGTTYDFDVVSANAGAMSSTSGNSTFMTTSVVSSPPVITNVATTNLTSTSVTVTWTTDQPSSSLVNYGTTMSYGSSSTLNTTLVTSHSVTLSGLAASTAYDFDVVSANAAAQSTTSPNSTFSTLASTATPPQVGYVVAWGVNNSSATVTWSTDVFANTQLAYGTTMALGQLSPLQTAMTQSHGVVLSGLISGTTYYYQAQSTGANGATGYSTVMSFTTTGTAPAGPPVISNVLVSNITNTSATITWTTDQASSSLVNYGTTNGYGSASALDPTLVTSHTVTLTGLTLGTTYDFDVVSANVGAMSATSGNSTFMTTSVVSSPPVITNVATTNLTSTSVTVTWTTDQPSSSLVNYGTTTSYGSSSTLNTTLVTSHSVTLSGLAAGTAYDFDVVSANAAAQSTTSPNSTFSTLASTATPPQVGYVDFWGVNNNGITISWSTDVLATTQIAYGTTTALGQLSPLQTALTNSHGVVLTTLNPGTTYYFVAQSTGANGATGYSTTYSFTTTGTQTTPPPVISNVVATSVSNTSETITWTTDQSASSQVSYGATTTYSNSTTLDPTLVTSHSVTLTGLTPGTTYDFDVMSANSLALSSTSTNSSFTTTGTAPAPVITNVGSSGVTSGTATITWTTDQASTSVVNYGTTTGYGSSASSAGLVTTHSVMLTGLSPNTTYNFDVVSANAANTSSTSTNYTFKTSSNTAPPPVISYLDFWGVTGSGVTISWSTNEPATTAVAYGTTNALGQLSPVQTALTISHGVILTGLAAGTTYYFAAQSADGSGNTGYSTTLSFTTLPGPPTISSVTTNPAANHTATINWTTSVPTYSYVQFGTAAGVYNAYSAQTALTATPQCSLSYVPSGTIHYQLVSTDAYGNQVMSPDATFVEP